MRCHRLAAQPAGASWTAYVANFDSDTVTPINVATNVAGAPIDLGDGDGPNAVAITPDATTVYVVNTTSGDVTPINVASNVAGPPIDVGDDPVAIAITPDGATAYVVNQFSDDVTPIDSLDEHGRGPDRGRRGSGRHRHHPRWRDGVRRRAPSTTK